MPTYIILLRWTQQGIADIKNGPTRLDAAKQAFQARGAEIKAHYLVMGQYDLVSIVEAPDDETLAKLVLSVGSLGSVSSETLRAFTEDEYRQIVTALP
jgi:uncharacterized protein with GYD domain